MIVGNSEAWRRLHEHLVLYFCKWKFGQDSWCPQCNTDRYLPIYRGMIDRSLKNQKPRRTGSDGMASTEARSLLHGVVQELIKEAEAGETDYIHRRFVVS